MESLKPYAGMLVLCALGLGLLGYGVWEVVKPSEVKVEVIKENSQTDQSNSTIKVDVGGAVEKPGVYELSVGSRIGDALVLAGGLSAHADREWVSKTLNLAKEIKDQEKIFIPASQGSGDSANQRIRVSERQTSLVNINTASVGELDGLVGIGAVRAQAIIANRPYASTEELIIKAKIPESIYEKIKDSISVY